MAEYQYRTEKQAAQPRSKRLKQAGMAIASGSKSSGGVSMELINGLAAKLDKSLFDSMFELIPASDSNSTAYIKAKLTLASVKGLVTNTAGNVPAGGSGSGGSSFDRLDSWTAYTAEKAGYVLSAGLGYDLHSRVDAMEANVANWDAAYANNHEHSNKAVLDGITSGKVSNWNAVYSWYSGITAADSDDIINKWADIISFLSGISDTSTLEGLLSDIGTQITGVANRATTLEGYFTSGKAKNALLLEGHAASYFATATGLTAANAAITALDGRLDALDSMFTFVPASGTTPAYVRVNYTLASVKGLVTNTSGNVPAGSGGGSSFDRLDTWVGYTADKAGYVLSAALAKVMRDDIDELLAGSALSITTAGTGNAITSISKSGTVLTATKGSTFSLSGHTHTKSQITDFAHTHDYLPLSGGTLSGLLHFNYNGVIADIGPQNYGWFHFYTSEPVIFDKSLYVIGNYYGGSSYDRRLAYVDEIPTSLPANGGNADTLDNYHLGSIMSYGSGMTTETGAARWIRVAEFTSYMAEGIVSINHGYHSISPAPIILSASTRYVSTHGDFGLTQIGGTRDSFTKARIIWSNSTHTGYLEVYINSGAILHAVSCKIMNSNGGFIAITPINGSVPDGYIVAKEIDLTYGISTSAINVNSKLNISSDGKITPYSTGTRSAGMYGVYDPYKIGHIWSIGPAYAIPDDGSNFGDMYGFAYKYAYNSTGGNMAYGHQAVWCEGGVPRVAIGTHLWAAGNLYLGNLGSIPVIYNLYGITCYDDTDYSENKRWLNINSYGSGSSQLTRIYNYSDTIGYRPISIGYTDGSQLYIAANGSVGIGTTNPLAALGVYRADGNSVGYPLVNLGRGAAAPTAAVKYDTLLLYSDDVTTMRIWENDGTWMTLCAGDGYATYKSGHPIRFFSGCATTDYGYNATGNLGIYIATNGNVGIKTTDTTFSFNVNGGVRTNDWFYSDYGLYLIGSQVYYGQVSGYCSLSSSGNEICIDGRNDYILYVNSRKGCTGYAPGLWRWKAGSPDSWANFELGNVLAYGNLVATGGVVTKYTSDCRTKNELSHHDTYAQRLLSLGPVIDFEYNGLVRAADGIRHTGLYYHTVEGKLDSMCEEYEGYGALNYIHPDYINLIAGACQENTTEIEKLKKRLAQVEKENEYLKQIIAA